MKGVENFAGLLLLLVLTNECYPQANANLLKKRDTAFFTSTKVKIQAETGSLLVPENRTNKGSRLITVNYIRLKSFNPHPKEPLFYLEGGSRRSTWQAENPDYLNNWMPYLQISDIILYDQRGTRDEDLIHYWEGAYPENFLVSAQVAGDHWNGMGQRALAIYKEKGIDIMGYSITENAHDIEDLRKALKIDKISIMGFSFGTKLGLILIKLYGQHIENAVLAAVQGLDQAFEYPSLLNTQFKKIANMVARDERIHQEVPDLVKLLERVMKKLKENPVEVDIHSPITGQPMKVKVGAFGLALILNIDIGDAFDLPALPRLIYSIDQGDISVLKWFVQKRVIWAYGLPGMDITMNISSWGDRCQLARIEKEAEQSLFKNVTNFPFYSFKDIWPEFQPDLDFTEPVVSDVRTLLLSGELDYNTPPFQAERVKWGFSNATHLVVKNAGHEQILSNTIIKETIPRFFGGEDVSGIRASNKELRFIPMTGTDIQVSHPSVTRGKN